MAHKRKAAPPPDDGYEPAEIKVTSLAELVENGLESENISLADITAMVAAIPALKIPKKRGRRPDHPWSEIRAEIIRRILKDGRPVWPASDHKLADDISRWCGKQFGKEPPNSDLRAMIAALVALLRPLFP